MMEKIKIHLFADSGDFDSDVEALKCFCDDNIENYALTHSDIPDFDQGRFFDFLVFDWGGMSLGNSMLEHFSERVVKYAVEHPSKYIVIYSQMTEWAVKDAMLQLFENNKPTYSNILFSLEEMAEKIKQEANTKAGEQ